MASITLNISNGVAPYVITIKRQGESNDRKISYFGGILNFNAETTNEVITYIISVTDDNGCNVERPINMNCYDSPDIPQFSYSFTQPTCISEGVYNPGVIHLSNIENATHYKLCYNTTTPCGDCTVRDGVITGSNMNINVDTPNFATTRGVLIILYNGSGCESYNTYFETMVVPSCDDEPTVTPNFDFSLLQPYCSAASGGSIVNAVLKLTNMTNVHSYKICYDSLTFNSGCQSSCASRDGFLSGSSVDITITAPSQGTNRNITLRVFSDATCDGYKDVSFTISSPECNGQYTMVVLSILTNSATSTGCLNPVTDFDMYMTPNTIGMSENGEKSQAKGSSDRNLPNGSNVPDVLVSASISLSCGPGPFYRWALNLSNLKSKYPSINVFTFDVYANRTKGSNNLLTPQTVSFPGVRMINQLYKSTYDANYGNDALRDPLYNGTIVNTGNYSYNGGVTGYRKIGTLTYNKSANTVVYTNA